MRNRSSWGPVTQLLIRFNTKLRGHAAQVTSHGSVRTFEMPEIYLQDEVYAFGVAITLAVQRPEDVVIEIGFEHLVTPLSAFIKRLRRKRVRVQAAPQVRRSRAYQLAVSSGLLPKEGEWLQVA